MPENVVDILENDFSPEILAQLLSDHTTGRNILWCTHDYESKGEGYQYADEIRRELITGQHGTIIRPRVLKSKVEQSDRVKDMAEVFTPSWVVKMIVDYVEISVGTRSLELTCGEAPFLVSRYDATTGEPIAISERVGLLDRKLRMVNEQQLSNADWLAQVRLAFQTTYGYEWQGDSLLLARENLLYTFVDHYEARFGSAPEDTLLQEFAEIISWNLWQMDGLTYCIPREKKTEAQQAQLSLFDEAPAEAPAPLCIIMDWQKGKTIKVIDIKRKQTKNQDIMKFDVIIGNPPYQDETVGEQKTMQPPIYHYFLDETYRCGKIVELIHPARFLFNAGATPKSWNSKMLNDKHFKVLHYESNSKEFFLNQEIKAGIAISYHDSSKNFGAIEVFTPFDELNSLLHTVKNHSSFNSMSSIVVSRTAYRFTDVMHKEHPEALSMLSKGHPYDMSTNIFERIPQVFSNEKYSDGKDYIQIMGRNDQERICKYVRRDYIKPVDNLDFFKVLLTSANKNGEYGESLTPPVLGLPGVGNTETFISIGKFKTEQEAQALMRYIKSKFARALLGILKRTHHLTPEVWKYVPLQDFTPSSDIDWSKSIAEIDKQLFDKYGLDEQERNFIRTKVKEMA